MIQFEDFEEEFVGDNPTPFYKHLVGDVQICLEPCAGGMCVGIYDMADWLLANKQCTNMPGQPKFAVQSQAVALVNVMYEEWKSKNVIE